MYDKNKKKKEEMKKIYNMLGNFVFNALGILGMFSFTIGALITLKSVTGGAVVMMTSVLNTWFCFLIANSLYLDPSLSYLASEPVIRMQRGKLLSSQLQKFWLIDFELTRFHCIYKL